jgi:hypothetical protein
MGNVPSLILRKVQHVHSLVCPGLTHTSSNRLLVSDYYAMLLKVPRSHTSSTTPFIGL